MDLYIHTCIHTYIHTHVQTDTCMSIHMQTDRHTCTCIDGPTKSMYRQTDNILIETYIIICRDIDRNIHARACRGKYIRVHVQIGWLEETYLCTDILVESYMSMQVVCTSKIYGPNCLMNLGRVVLFS